jgi:hypothetical protein
MAPEWHRRHLAICIHYPHHFTVNTSSYPLVGIDPFPPFVKFAAIN